MPSPQELKALRLSAGLTQRQLSKLSGVRQAAISQYETGKTGLHVDSYNKLIEALINKKAPK